MFKVLIVDDEVWIRKSLKKIIAWDKLELTLSGEASNGKEAIQLALLHKPDIVITDVRMPEINGLMLTEEILNKLPDTKIIIISGFDEFEYVKRAINYNVVSYILKPIDKTELNKILEKSTAKINKNRQNQELLLNIPLVLEKKISDLVSGNVKDFNQLETWINKWELNGEQYCIAIIQYSQFQYEKFVFKEKIKTLFEEICRKEFIISLFSKENGRLTAFLIKKYKDSKISTLINKLSFALNKSDISYYNIGVGSSYDNIRDISSSYSQAIQALESIHINTKDGVKYFKENENEISCNYPVELQKVYVTNTLLCKSEKIHELITEMKEFSEDKNNVKMVDVRKIVFGIITEIIKHAGYDSNFDKSVLNEGFEFCNKLQEYRSHEEIINWLELYSYQVIDVIKNSSNRNIQRKIDEIIAYVQENFFEHINLNTISTNFHINSSYFSSIFKEKTEQNFIDYLTKVRIQKAKELLDESDLKITQICKMVGYDDSRYFSKLFKKHTGKQPTQYRNKI